MTEEWKKVTAEWIGESAFLGRNSAGGTVQIGTLGGKPGVGPMEMLLLGLAGCTGMDIVSILTKKRQAISDFKVQVRAKRAETYPKIYTEIEVTYLLWGEDLDPQAIESAIQLSEEKYCSVGLMLEKAAEIRSEYQVLKPGEIFEG